MFNEKLIEILTQKSKLKKDETRIVNKLRKQERLSDNEFWRVYESIWQDGPKVKYLNLHNWASSDK